MININYIGVLNVQRCKIIKDCLTIKERGDIYSINESNKYMWTTKNVSGLIDALIQKGYSSRWVGSRVRGMVGKSF